MRSFLTTCVGLLALATPVLAAGSQPHVPRALTWLAEQQARDGSWGKNDKLALTGMSGLALLASGSTPTRGPYAPNILRAVEFVLGTQTDRRAFTHSSSGYSYIHNHGYALLFLTQCYGEGGELDERLAQAIRQGVKATVASQFQNGGFGYALYRKPGPAQSGMWEDDEASTTVSQIQALRGARNAGFDVPRQALERAGDYIAKSQHSSGGFVYSIAEGKIKVSLVEGSNSPTFAITAAAAAVLNALGTYEGPALERGVEYMEAFLPPSRRRERFFYYGHYYAAQVMAMRGGTRGRRWLDAIYAELAERQSSTGYWKADQDDTLASDDSRILNTAWAIQISLIERGLPRSTSASRRTPREAPPSDVLPVRRAA
ncbi:MAG: prenyltransferase/squalene oxidase repeat-containing protein [Planctomycetota bacterium]